ncbi:MAG: hypothetical protein ACOX7K_09135 [Oscillospiraceae bacterium]|jgi:hypothetical protein
MKIPVNRTLIKVFIAILVTYCFIFMYLSLEYGIDTLTMFLFLLILIPIGYNVIITWRRYDINAEGITEHWLFGISRRYNWTDFQSVRIIDLKEKPSTYNRYFVFSRRLLPYPVEGATSMTSWYRFRHPFTTMLIEFTPERYEEFCEKFPDIKLEWESTY